MTPFVVHEGEPGGSGTHVLVIGYGKYPHLLGGDSPYANPDGMGQLSSPPLSARAVADWFIEEYHDRQKNVASVALLLSERDRQPFVNSKTGESHVVEEANVDNA